MVVEGETERLVPETAPTSGERERLFAPVVLHVSVVPPPAVIDIGFAAKVSITGGVRLSVTVNEIIAEFGGRIPANAETMASAHCRCISVVPASLGCTSPEGIHSVWPKNAA